MDYVFLYTLILLFFKINNTILISDISSFLKSKKTK